MYVYLLVLVLGRIKRFTGRLGIALVLLVRVKLFACIMKILQHTAILDSVHRDQVKRFRRLSVPVPVGAITRYEPPHFDRKRGEWTYFASRLSYHRHYYSS